MISKLTELFFKLTDELTMMKQANKSDLTKYYRDQTYPKNPKPKDLTKIKQQVEEMKALMDQNIMLPSEHNTSENIKLIPSFDE